MNSVLLFQLSTIASYHYIIHGPKVHVFENTKHLLAAFKVMEQSIPYAYDVHLIHVPIRSSNVEEFGVLLVRIVHNRHAHHCFSCIRHSFVCRIHHNSPVDCYRVMKLSACWQLKLQDK